MASYPEANAGGSASASAAAAADVASLAASQQPQQQPHPLHVLTQPHHHHHHHDHHDHHQENDHDHDHNHSHSHDHQPTVTAAAQHPTLYDDAALTSPLPATAVAHHGLQALQAVSGAPMSPTSNDLAQQYAQSAALQMGEPQFSSALAASGLTAPHMGSHASIHASQKVTRLRRACDMCSQRKVKCDESGPPCKPCSDLQVECTFRREMKRRGPPNKHAEAARAAKRHQINNISPIQHHTITTAAHNPITTAHDTITTATITPTAPTDGLADGLTIGDAEAIAPWHVLQLLVDDFFIYVHPLMPFPHEPTFRHAFENRADRTDREFLALLASMIGILVASFPRSARAHLKAQHSAELFPTAVVMIDHCRSIALDARGSTYVTKHEMSVDDAATSYFLGLAAGYTLQWKMCMRFLSEAMSFCKELRAPGPRNLSGLVAYPPELAAAAADSIANRPIDHIKDQMGKRIFWAVAAGIRSISQLGVSINELPTLPPPTTQEPYPEEPLEVDDEYIFVDQILAQPEGSISLITGFNRNIRMYMTMNELIGVEMCYGINFFDWSAQKNIVSNGLESAIVAVKDLPPHLQVFRVDSDRNDPSELDQAGLQYCPPGLPGSQPENDIRRVPSEPSLRRQLQVEIQKANIHAAQLATRSYFVERYLNLRDAHPENAQAAKDMRDEMVAEERESIVQDLFAVLTSISQRNLEPNGQSTMNKIRQVASTLVEGASERKGPVAIKAEEYLNGFIEILVKLERSGTAAMVGITTDTMGPQDEEEELRNWVSLRDYQMQFVSSRDFLGDNI